MLNIWEAVKKLAIAYFLCYNYLGNKVNQLTGKRLVTMTNEKILTWEELYKLAIRNYNRGGDSIVEYYTEEFYNAVYPEGLTEEQALEQFAIVYDIETEWSY